MYHETTVVPVCETLVLGLRATRERKSQRIWMSRNNARGGMSKMVLKMDSHAPSLTSAELADRTESKIFDKITGDQH